MRKKLDYFFLLKTRFTFFLPEMLEKKNKSVKTCLVKMWMGNSLNRQRRCICIRNAEHDDSIKESGCWMGRHFFWVSERGWKQFMCLESLFLLSTSTTNTLYMCMLLLFSFFSFRVILFFFFLNVLCFGCISMFLLCSMCPVCGTFTLSHLVYHIGDGMAWHLALVWCVYGEYILLWWWDKDVRVDMSFALALYAYLCSLCDCDYVLLYYFDLVIRSAGSQKIYFWYICVSSCVWVFMCVCMCVCTRETYIIFLYVFLSSMAITLH